MSNPQNVTVYFQSGLKVQAHKSAKPVVNTHEIPWDPAWLAQPTNVFHHNLALAGAGLALSSYENLPSNKYGHILQTLASFGLRDVDISSFYHRTEEDPSDFKKTVNLVAYAFAQADIPQADGSTQTCVVCVVRGTAPTVEWNSNGDIADSVTGGDYSHVKYHEGFRASEQEMLGALKKYLADYKVDVPAARFWVVGHSRGACIANILGADLDDGPTYGIPVKPEQVFCYCYASSGTTFLDGVHKAPYDNIFNLVHPEDFIPRVPMARWGLETFGTTLFFPSICTNYEQHKRLYAPMRRIFETIADCPMLSFRGLFPTDTFARKANDLAADVKEYYERKHLGSGRWYTFRQYFSLFTNECAQHGAAHVKVTGELLAASRGAFSPFLSYFFNHQIIMAEIPFVHSAEAFVARLQAMGELGMDMAACARRDTYRITFYGPVDLRVTDPAGTTVARVAGGSPDHSYFDTPESVSVAVDHEIDAVHVWLPDLPGFKLAYSRGTSDKREREQERAGTSTEEYLMPVDVPGTVAWQACQGAVIAQEAFVEEGLTYEEVREWTRKPPAMPAFPGPDRDLGDEMQAYAMAAPVINVGAQPCGRGDAVGANAASLGDHVAVVAYDEWAANFTGWFDKPKHHLGETGPKPVRLSREKTYVMEAARDMTVYAHFEAI